MRNLILSILVITVLLLSSCAPAGISEPPIPTHYTTYTDKARLFSISYPPKWELGLSQIKGITQDLNDYWTGRGQDYTIKENTVVFFAGVPYQSGYNPNISIILIPAGEGTWKLDDFVETIVQQGLMKYGQEYREFSRHESVVDGKKAILLEYEVAFPPLGKLHALDMYMRDGRMLIKVEGGVIAPKDFSDFETDIHATVSSFRMLKSSATSQNERGLFDGVLDATIRGAITALPLAIIAGLVVIVRWLVQKRKTNKPNSPL